MASSNSTTASSQDPLEATFQMILTETRAKPQGKDWLGHCPAHEDKKPSFSIGRGPAGHILLKCHTGCDIASICAAIPCDVADLSPPKTQGKPKYNIDKIYD